MDRHIIAQALAKVCAYITCGKLTEAEQWFVKLASYLGMGHLLK
jgi:predicted ATPase